MKVLRAHENGDAQAELLTQGLLNAGHQADVCLWDRSSLPSFGPSDIVHVHGAAAVASRLAECTAYLDQHRTVRIIQYATREIRSRDEAVRTNFYAHLDENYDEHAIARLAQLSAVFPACIVKNAEAAEYAIQYHQRVYIVPEAIDPATVGDPPGWPAASSRPLVIVHLGSDGSKGSEFVEKAVALLQNIGYNLRYERGQQLGHADAIQLLKKADIVIDQLFHGAYGKVAIEAMALGKPVLSHLREDLKPKWVPDLPVVAANPATVIRKLIPVLEHRELRQQLGEAGRKYAETYHFINAVIPKLLWVYRNELEPGTLQMRAIFDTFTGKVYPVANPSTSQPVANETARAVHRRKRPRAKVRVRRRRLRKRFAPRSAKRAARVIKKRRLPPKRFLARRRSSRRSARRPKSARNTRAMKKQLVRLKRKRKGSFNRIKRAWLARRGRKTRQPAYSGRKFRLRRTGRLTRRRRAGPVRYGYRRRRAKYKL